MDHIQRIFVEKKSGFDELAVNMKQEFQTFLGIKGLTQLRLVHRYDFSMDETTFNTLHQEIFPSTLSEQVFVDDLPLDTNAQILIKEYLPGQFVPQARGVLQAMKLLTQEEPLLHTAQIMILEGDISPADLEAIKNYWINPLEAKEGQWAKPQTLSTKKVNPQKVALLTGFINKSPEELTAFHQELGLAMSLEDLAYCQTYFQKEERDPTITEIRIIDTYWSDHCRHKTFFTPIREVSIADGLYTQPISHAYEAYLQTRKEIYQDLDKDLCLMDLALIGMRELRSKGLLDDLDLSEEINACSINVTVHVDGQPEDWLVMFKNETHNHPTEIEPFGGAATCLGGAIRDPLSGRSYIYQAMRVSGGGDPNTPYQNTLPGKLPQRQITTEAAKGYSSYGNQIGVPTGQVAEIYDEGYLAKRLECGAVVAAAPKENVRRQSPQPGDVILLVGGKTGRDGCGGATGSSKEHTEETEPTWGSEIPKGNPSEERKLLRLFRNPAASTLIKKCNDFGAGGVSVAVGELADGVTIDLDQIPTSYHGLDGTELAISESQERMAVVVAPQDAPTFIQLAEKENLVAKAVAGVTPENRVKMFWQGNLIVDLEREFLDSGGIKEDTSVVVTPPNPDNNGLKIIPSQVRENLSDLKEAWLANLQDLNVCSQADMASIFDSTAGGGTVVAPYGGQYQATPAEGMVAKIPVVHGETTTGTIMTFGYNPQVTRWSPFHGGLYAVIEAVAKNVALGGDHRTIRMTFQEYFEKLEDLPEKWGKPFSALLGAYWGQKQFQIPAIGGKDSMSGTWQDLNVPPTLIAFTVNTVKVDKTITAEFKASGTQVVLVTATKDETAMPDFQVLNKNYERIHSLIQQGHVLAASTIKAGGLAATISQMAFGNGLGMEFTATIPPEELFQPDYGSMVLEMKAEVKLEEAFDGVDYQVLGTTQAGEMIQINGVDISLEEAYKAWHRENPLVSVFGQKETLSPAPLREDYPTYTQRAEHPIALAFAKPRVLIPVFPGTNGEYESKAAFTKAGGQSKTFVLRDQTKDELETSLKELAKELIQSQILMLPGGFSNWDEPEGAGKYIERVFRQPVMREALETFLSKNGLILGIGNGFQGLLRLGLLPYGQIREWEQDSSRPILTLNWGGKHISRYVQTKVTSVLSPWFHYLNIGDQHTIPISCTQGRLVAREEEIEQLLKQGQIATQYIDDSGRPTAQYPFNPTGSYHAIEGLTSPDGRILGKMGHSERFGPHVGINIPGNKDQQLFKAAIDYFR